VVFVYVTFALALTVVSVDAVIVSLPVLTVADWPVVRVADYSADTVDYSTKFPVLPAAISPFTFVLCSACTILNVLIIEDISVEDTFMLPLSTDF